MATNDLHETAAISALPKLGFGGATLGNLYQPMSDADAHDTVDRAWQRGLRYFDTAPYYGLGLSEIRLGQALAHYPRADFLVSSKVGRVLEPDPSADVAQIRYGFASPLPFRPRFDYSYDGVMRSFEDSLKRLGLTRIDIALVHDIGQVTHGAANAAHFDALAKGGYRALEELRANGDCARIGLGVNEWEICEAAMQIGRFDCFLLAGRYTLLEQGAMHSFLPACADQGISVIAGGVYNSGILATGTRRNAPAAQTLRHNYEAANPAIVDRVARIEAIADRHGVTLAAAALQFPLAHPAVSTVIPGLASADQVDQTLALMGEVIPAAFWQDLKASALLPEHTPTPAPQSAGVAA